MPANQLKPFERTIGNVARQYHRAAAAPELSWSQEKLHAIAVVRTSRDLQNAIPATLESAVLQAASMGLTLNPQKNHCYIIPRRTKRGDPNAAIIAYASPSYRGLSHILVKEGLVRYIRAQVVYNWDYFNYLGPDLRPEYKATVIGKDLTQESAAVGVYAIAKTSDGDILCEFMDRAIVQRIRNMSEMKNGAIWAPDKMWTEGWKKAAIRRFVKTLPDAGVISTPRVDSAIEVLNTNESIDTSKGGRDISDEVVQVCSDEQIIKLKEYIEESGLKIERILKAFEVEKLSDLPQDRYEECLTRVKAYYANAS